MLRLAINGFGRIGRSILRAFYERKLQDRAKIVAINDLASSEIITYLTKYDTTHGQFSYNVSNNCGNLKIDDDIILLYQEPTPIKLPWSDLKIDLVFENTGIFVDRKSAEDHLCAGAKKVLISHPSTRDVDSIIVYGVNHYQLDWQKHSIVSSASCTSNCLVPVIDILDRYFSVDYGVVTTIHPMMNDQKVIDSMDSYRKNISMLRLCRAASNSIVPVKTNIARTTERIFPHLKGKLEANSIRVPTLNVTALDLSIILKTKVNIANVNKVFLQESTERMRGILDYNILPLVSCDFNNNPHSCIIDSTQTIVCNDNLLKLLLWCDNEWGFANRMIDIFLQLEKKWG